MVSRNGDKLKDLHERKINNGQSISKHHQVEQTLHEIDVKERRIMNRLFEFWKKDRDFSMQFNHIAVDLDEHKQFIQREVSNRKRELFQEKRKLYRLEDEMYDQERKTRREDESLEYKYVYRRSRDSNG